MARGGFFSDNEGRMYPFQPFGAIRGQYTTTLDTEFLLPNPTIVDFGSVFGPEAGYDPTEHKIWLQSVSRAGTTLTFEFRTNVPALSDSALIFTRQITDAAYSHEFADADIVPGSSASLGELCGPAVIWDGFLVTGDLTDLLELLPGDGELVANSVNDMVIEPGCIQDLGNGFIRSINLANAPRLIAPPADDCSSLSSFTVSREIVVNATCLQGVLKLKEGFNVSIQQDQAENSITIGAGVGDGLGEPCEEVPLDSSETQQPGSKLLSGGPTCGEIITSINGLPGPLINIRGGSGVVVEPDSEVPHKLLVNVNFRGLALCPDTGNTSSSSSSSQ